MNHADAYIDLRRMLRMHCIRSGTKFTLASGRESDFFIDCKQAVLSARGHRLAGMLLLNKIRGRFPQAVAVAGVELGGCPLASAVATLSSVDEGGARELDALYVRKATKDHGTQALIEGATSVRPRAHLVLLEDVVTTGASSLRAIDTLNKADYRVLGVIALVDREEGAEEAFDQAGLDFVSIYTQRSLREDVAT